MARAIFVVVLSCCAFLLSASAFGQFTVEVLDATIATSIEDRQPQGMLASLGRCNGNGQEARISPTTHDKIFLWTRVKSDSQQTLWHTYYKAYKDDLQNLEWKMVQRITLPVGASSGWRTWSEKSLRNAGALGLLGAWKVEVAAASNPSEVLCTTHFYVGDSEN